MKAINGFAMPYLIEVTLSNVDVKYKALLLVSKQFSYTARKTFCINFLKASTNSTFWENIFLSFVFENVF